MTAQKKGGLGRGLDALFADAVPAFDDDTDVGAVMDVKETRNGF